LTLKIRHSKNENVLSDREIILEYRQHNKPGILSPLFENYMHLVFGVCMKYLKNTREAEDATMDIFEKLFKDLLEHEVDNFPAWLHTVSRNHCLMILRSKKNISTGLDEKEGIKLLRDFVESEPGLHHYNEHEDELSLMENALSRLNAEQGQCLSLFYLSGKSYQEVANETGFSLKQVKSYIQNGKRNLKNQMILIRDGKSS